MNKTCPRETIAETDARGRGADEVKKKKYPKHARGYRARHGLCKSSSYARATSASLARKQPLVRRSPTPFPELCDSNSPASHNHFVFSVKSVISFFLTLACFVPIVPARNNDNGPQKRHYLPVAVHGHRGRRSREAYNSQPNSIAAPSTPANAALGDCLRRAPAESSGSA